jgi:hypothetical protein
MPRQITVYRGLVVSPGDVKPARDAFSQIASLWNANVGFELGVGIDAVRWETHAYPDVADEPQTVINRQLAEACDFGVAVFGSRLGTPTSAYLSGSVEEVNQLLNAGKPVMAYFQRRKRRPSGVSVEQWQLLQQFRNGLERRGLVFSFGTLSELRQYWLMHLFRVIITLHGSPSSQ